MKNYKYIKMTQEYLDDDNLISLLQQEAKEGWLIKKMDHSYITFTKCEQKTLKFQIDYVTITKEYKNVMTELGYRYLCSLDGMNIYCNEDLDAQDLYNDDITKVMSQLHFFRFSKIAYSLLWIFICLVQLFVDYNNMLFKFYRHSLGAFYLRSSEYIIMGMWIVCLIVHALNLMYLWCMRRYYKKQLNEHVCERIDIKYLKIYDFLQQINFTLLLVVLPLLINSLTSRYDFIRMSIIAGLSLSLINVIVELFKRHKFKKFIYGFSVVMSIGAGLSLYNMTLIDLPVDKLFYEDKVKDVYIDQADDMLSSYKMIHIFHNDYYEKCVVSLNEVCSKEIFKEELITLDAYARKAITSNNYSKYEEVIKTMNVLEDKRIDEGFYNYNYVIFRKDNLVVSFRRVDVPMDEVIEYYLSK